MTLESIEKLRELVKSFHSLKPRWDTLAAIDEVEREIERDHMKLPVDEDGVPWTIADKKFADILGETHTITGILYSSLTGTWYLCDAHDVTHNARQCRHVEPRTIEDVLIEYRLHAYNIYADDEINGEERVEEFKELDSKYVAELRELMGGDA